MKKVKFVAEIAVLALTVAAIACKPNHGKTFEGVVGDATMNTLMLVDTETDDTLLFSTLDTEYIGNGLLIGDMVKVTYTKSRDGGIDHAERVVIESDKREGSLLVGDWIESIELGDTVITQGVSLLESGAATSINMATLVYETWSKVGDKLILTGQSIGNGQTIPFIAYYTIEQKDENSLDLTDGDLTISYTRRQVDDTVSATPTRPEN